MPSLTVDELVVLINAETSDFKKQVALINDQLDGIGKQTGKMSKTSTIAFGVIAGAAQVLVSKGIDLITGSIGAAASRVDTLNNSNKVFQNLGFSAQDTKKNMDFLDESILGLPTSLNDAVGGVEALASVSGDLDDSTKTYKALNDGILAMGGSADMVKGAVLQLSQLPLDGPLDAQTWNSLRQNGLTPVISAMAKDMGTSIGQLKKDFGTGKLTVQDFTDELQKLDTHGGGGMASLETQAKDATDGIQTGWANMRTAVTRGVADIIKSIGSKNVSSAISGIGKFFESALKDISGIIQFIKNNSTVFGTIAAAVAGVVAAVTLWAAITKVVTIAQAAFNAVMALNPISIIIIAVAALVAGLAYFFTQTQLGQQIWAGFVDFLIAAWTDIQTAWSVVVDFFQAIWDGVVAVFNGVLNFLIKWGPTILAVAFWPIALIVGTIIKYWRPITDFFQAIWNGIVAIFSPVVAFYAGIFGGAWSVIKDIWNVVIDWFKSIWSGIIAIFSPVVSFYANVFGKAYSAVTGVFSKLYGFFKGVWDKIVGLFGGIGTKVGNVIGNAFKGVINGVLNVAVGIINGFIDTINGAIGIINAIPGVNIGKLGRLGVPQLAEGGIVMPRPGGMLANIAEAGQPEAVIPLDKLQGIMDGRQTPVSVQIDGRTLLSFVIDGINNKAFMTNQAVIDY